MLIKNNEHLFVDIDSKKGYVIRLRRHEGATFTVTENSTVVVGQSGKYEYTKEELNLLQAEISAGMAYMENVRQNGYPTLRDVYCKPEPNCVYEDERGNIILYFGQGKFIEEKSKNNRTGYEYICGKIKRYNYPNDKLNLDWLYVKENGTIYMENGDDSWINIENTSTPPKKLVKLLYVLPENCTEMQILHNVHYSECSYIDDIKWEKHWENRQTGIPEKRLLPYSEPNIKDDIFERD